MADELHDPPSTADQQAVDARLRAAGERLRATAPTTEATPSSMAGGRPTRAWYAGGAAALVAAAVVAFVVLPGSGDETIRETPADRPPVTESPEVTGPDETISEPTPQVGPAPTELPMPTIGLAENTDDVDWDGRGGQCHRLVVDSVAEPREIPMCVTGLQIDHGADAYVRGDGYAYRWFGARRDDGTIGAIAGGGVTVDGEPGFPPSDEVPCGPPAHDVPDHRWVMVSHCDGDAALYTVLPATPDDEPTYLIGSADGTVHRTVVLDQREILVEGRPNRLVALDVPAPIGGSPATCLVVVLESAERWLEGCSTTTLPSFDRLFVVGDAPWMFEWDGTGRFVELATDARLRTNGCSSPVLEMLHAVERFLETTMISGVACAAPASAGEPWNGDRMVEAVQPAMLLRDGPQDGLLLRLERLDDGQLEVADAGRFLDPQIGPLMIPPPEWISHGADESLPTRDMTSVFRESIPHASTGTGMTLAISNLLADLSPTEDGSTHEVETIEGRPLLIAPSVTYLDDSVGSGTYAVWVVRADDRIVIERVYVTDRCSRGLTETDGMVLCV